VGKVKIETCDPLNTSPHRAVSCTLSVRVGGRSPNAHINKPHDSTAKVKWDKVDVAKYREIVSEKLSVIQPFIDSPPEILIERLQDILISSAASCCPPVRRTPSNFKRPWNLEIKNASKVSKAKFYDWKQAGRPQDINHPKRKDMISAKRDLRRAQRQTEAEARNNRHTKLMEASERDQGMFYQLIRKQRCDNTRVPEEILFGERKSRGPELLSDWADYFQTLATPVNLPNYDDAYQNSCALQCELLNSITEMRQDTSQLPCIDPDEIRKVVMTFKNRKAPDEAGLSAEHLKNSPVAIFDVLTKVLTEILGRASVPASFTTGIVTPVHKKGKPVKNADSYRRITVTPIISKILEKLLIPEQDLVLDDSQNKMQRGFTVRCSSANTALLVTEMCAEAKDNKLPLYVAFLDASKAFDVVCHTSLLKTLYDQGIRGNLWRLVASYYSSMTSKVKWNGAISETFGESQGIRQGGIQSTRHFKARGNPLLNVYTASDIGAKIGIQNVSAPTCADDVTLMASTPSDLQVMLNVASQDSNRERYQFSRTKTKVMYVNGKPLQSPLVGTGRWDIEGAPLEVVTRQEHLGIGREADPSKTSKFIAERIKLGRRSTYAFMGAGVHGLNGLHPMASIRIWDTFVLPRLVHSLEAMVIPEKDLASIEIYQRGTLRRIQHLPQSASNNAVYLLLGECPISGTVHRNILGFFGSLILQRESAEFAIIQRQLAMKDLDSSSWVVHIRKLLYEYDLPSAFSLVLDPMPKDRWKALVKQCVHAYHEKQLQEHASIQTSLKYFNSKACGIGRPHPLWKSVGTSKLDILRGSVKAKLLTGSYQLQARVSRQSGGNVSPLCLLCCLDREVTDHFMVACPALEKTRQPYLNELKLLLNPHSTIDWSWNNTAALTQLLLDCSHPSLGVLPGVQPTVEEVTRRCCYALHCERATRLAQLQPGGKPGRTRTTR
jgi:hypothetical protein